MAKFKDRYNLFTGKLRVAPRPFVPPHWNVPEDSPSATRFWVNVETGATSACREGEGWTFSEALRQWHLRQCARVWAGRRLVVLHDHDAAQARIKDLQTEVGRKIRTANSYLDVLVSIAYASCRLTRRAERAEQTLVDTTRQIIQIASFLDDRADSLSAAGSDVVARAQQAARDLDQLAESLKQTVSPVDRRFDPAPLAAAPEKRDRDVFEWVRYTTPARKYREPDVRWLVASAVVTFLEDNPDVTTQIACERVGGYLGMLDAPFGPVHA